MPRFWTLRFIPAPADADFGNKGVPAATVAERRGSM
jgi:hypothetical protein